MITQIRILIADGRLDSAYYEYSATSLPPPPVLESAAVQTDTAGTTDAAPAIAEGESGAGEKGGSDGGGGDDDDDGGGDDDDPHGVGRGASPIPWLLIALLPLRVISGFDAAVAPAAHVPSPPEYPEPSTHPTLDVDIRATLAEFEGLLATLPNLSAAKTDERGTWAQWVISMRRHRSSIHGYVSAHELQGITTLRFFELQGHPLSIRDGPCRKLAARILDALPQRCLLHEERGVPISGRRYDLAAVRGLLVSAFNTQGLHRFLYYRPRFRPIIHSFGPGHGLSDMVDRAIGYCEQQYLLEDLLSEVASHNPGQYRRWAPHLTGAVTGD